MPICSWIGQAIFANVIEKAMHEGYTAYPVTPSDSSKDLEFGKNQADHSSIENTLPGNC